MMFRLPFGQIRASTVRPSRVVQSLHLPDQDIMAAFIQVAQDHMPMLTDYDSMPRRTDIGITEISHALPSGDTYLIIQKDSVYYLPDLGLSMNHRIDACEFIEEYYMAKTRMELNPLTQHSWENELTYQDRVEATLLQVSLNSFLHWIGESYAPVEDVDIRFLADDGVIEPFRFGPVDCLALTNYERQISIDEDDD